MISVTNATVSFGKNLVLDNISLSIDRGCIVGLVAPNGAGKTTLLRTIVGAIKQPAGCVSIEGVNPKAQLAFRRKVFFIEDAQVLNPKLSASD